jgi:hypothetical protein
MVVIQKFILVVVELSSASPFFTHHIHTFSSHPDPTEVSSKLSYASGI